MNDNNASDWIYLLMALVAGGLSMIKSLSKKKTYSFTSAFRRGD